MSAGPITGGRSRVFPGDRSKGPAIGSVDLVRDLIGRIDDVQPKSKVLGEREFYSKLVLGSSSGM